MLDDEHGVAEALQALEGLEQAVVVLLVEADRRLVEDVEDAGQAGADLRREADALALAAAQCARLAVEVQVIEPDIVQEAEALVDLLEDGAGDLALLRGQPLLERRRTSRRRRRPSGAVPELICSPAIFTDSASGLRRAPWQTSHGRLPW